MLSFPRAFTEQQALNVIARLQQLPAVEKIVAASAANLEFRTADFARGYASNQAMPEHTRRGLDRDEHSSMTLAEIDEAAQMPHVPNQLVVRWKSRHVWRATAAGFLRDVANFHAAGGARVIKEMRTSVTDLTQVIEFTDQVIPFANKLRRYANCPWVDYAQPNFIYTLDTGITPNDPLYANPGQPNLPKISAPSAWGVTQGDHNVVVAVADTGANINHPDFGGPPGTSSSNISPGWRNYAAGDPNDVSDGDPCVPFHGSHVASIIGAKGNNGQWMTGVAWNVSLLIIRASAGCDADSALFAQAINYAWSNEGHVPAIAINISSGIHGPKIDPTLHLAVQNAQAHNMVVVASAGNNNRNLDFPGTDWVSPACIPTDNVITVGATRVRPDDLTKDDHRAEYSNWGRYRVELGAPGGDGGSGNCDYGIVGHLPYPTTTPIATCSPFPLGWQKLSGTSMAAPHVTGALALVKSEYPWENYAGLRDRVIMSTDDLDDVRPDGATPFRTGGRLNLYKALQKRTLIKNLSTRAKVESGDRIIIGGFTIRGNCGGPSQPPCSPCGGPSQPPCLKVVIRGIGPSLTAFGVPNALPDPELVLNNSDGKQIFSNEDWQDDAAQAAELTSLGFAPTDQREAAMVHELAPGSYTVLLRSQQQGQEGIGTFQIYEIRGNTGDETRLNNLSTRCIVGTGSEVAIAGTILQNPGPTPTLWPKRRILAFGRGPSLQLFGLTGTLPDPYLEFRDGAGGLIDYNDQWKSIDGLSTGLQDKLVEEHPGFMPVPKADEQYENESALWPTLQTGSYTVILKDAHNDSGLGLIELYEY